MSLSAADFLVTADFTTEDILILTASDSSAADESLTRFLVTAASWAILDMIEVDVWRGCRVKL